MSRLAAPPYRAPGEGQARPVAPRRRGTETGRGRARPAGLPPEGPRLTTPSAAQAFLERYEERVRPLQLRSADLRWRLAQTGDEGLLPELEAIERQIAEVHGDPDGFRLLSAWRGDPALTDPLVRRQVDRLWRWFLEKQGDPALRDRILELELRVEQAFTAFRAELDGRTVGDNELDRILEREADPALRERAWRATREVGRAVAETVIETARLRNRMARALGFADYRALALTVQEFDPVGLDALLDRFEASTRAPYAEAKAALDGELARRHGVGVDGLLPWHYPQRFHQSVPPADDEAGPDFPVERIGALTLTTFRGIGLPVDDLWAAADLLPRPGKNQHAFCLGVDSPRDIRVLMNLAPTERWMGTALHEFGHAAYEAGLPAELPYTLRCPAHTFTTEAIAMWFGRLTADPAWLERAAGVPRDEAARAWARMRRDQLVFARWGLAVSLFERALYRDPDQDLGAAWWGLVSRLQGIARPEGHDAPDWAAKVHIACHPAYYQNYLLGEMMASQLDSALDGATGASGGAALSDPRTGELFGRLFASGATRTWEETVAAVTGAPLSADAFARQFLGTGEV